MIRRCLIALFAIAALSGFARAEIAIQEVTSPGGITAWLVEERSIPIVAMEIDFQGGTSLDRPGKEGAVNLMTGLLEEGTDDMDAAAFQRATEELATRFSFDAGRDSVNVTLQSLSENIDASVELLRRALTAPAFNATAVERVRGQVISSLRSDATDPNVIARRTFYELAFPGHPYGRPPDGTLETVTALTADDLRAAHRDALTRGRAFIGVVGDISAAELAPLLDRLLGDLPAEGPPLPPRTEIAVGGGVTVVDFDTPQSVAMFGEAGLERKDPDFFAAYVMNHILGGGGFSSRLTEEVREKRGLTYGVASYLVPFDHAALYLGSVASANDRIAQAIDLIRKEWRRMAEGGVTEEELDAAKRNLTGSYPLRFTSNAAIAGQLVGMQIDDLGIDYMIHRNDRINAITREDIARVAKRLLMPENLRVVVVGRPVGLESTD